jgi:hypothetical protein
MSSKNGSARWGIAPPPTIMRVPFSGPVDWVGGRAARIRKWEINRKRIMEKGGLGDRLSVRNVAVKLGGSDYFLLG